MFKETISVQYEEQREDEIAGTDLRDISVFLNLGIEGILDSITFGIYKEKIVSDKKKTVRVGVGKTPTVLIKRHLLKGGLLKAVLRADKISNSEGKRHPIKVSLRYYSQE